jgi:hypothetical protein
MQERLRVRVKSEKGTVAFYGVEHVEKPLCPVSA